MDLKVINELDTIYRKVYQQEDMKNWFDELKSIIELFNNGYNLEYLERQLLNYRDTLKNNGKKDEINKLNGLINNIKRRKSDFLIERLKRKGYVLAGDTNFKNAINSQIYRILELTRLNKREEVVHLLMRIFVSYQKKIPDELIETMKQKTDNNLFKAYIYSFLCGFIGEEKESKEEKLNE
ncbi:hypothetical protein [Thermoanaerobacterium thermosaccharolyticum]|uniref:hypothetical protein n=1 Tax=Thermoanaerobacterium thermosaccharolyticum TaxID=1517 RepID=UPI00177E72D6|nr:hypothetical protein [Thermoanaerobacterium thermosaccharolyticum]MBE0069225.1 hypothetical protein [Thermoanaerobacterium thermosaccharolyticum]MBE0228103.1 hypothetical protein [Thermoanaerobacterium thermosaccharolyticum]